MIEQDAAAWLARFAERSQAPEVIEEYVRQIHDRIIEVVPELAADPELLEEFDASGRAHFRMFFPRLIAESFELEAPAEVRELARTLARRGQDVTVVFDLFRVGQRIIWTLFNELFTDEIDDLALRAAVFHAFWNRGMAWLDHAAGVMVATHAEEHDRWQRGSIARRQALVARILNGEDEHEPNASSQLGHPLHLHQTALVLWSDGCDDEGAIASLEAEAVRCAAALGAIRPLVVTNGARSLWAWIASSESPDVRCLREREVAPGVRIAAGLPATGITGFRQSHREATAVQRVAFGGVLIEQFLDYADLELVCLASAGGDLDATRALVRRELGGLLATDDGTSRLRESVALYLSLGSNVQRAAEVLCVHPNSVRYRIQKAEGLLGHGLHERRAQLETALACVRAFGSEAFQTPSP